MKQDNINDNRYITSNSKLVTALTTIGVKLKKKDPVMRLYTEKSPKTAKGGGEARFSLETELLNSDDSKFETKDLVLAFVERTADDIFKEKLDALLVDSKGTDLYPKLLDLKRQFMFAMMSYMSVCLDNREKIIDYVKTLKGFLMIKKGEGFMLIHEDLKQDKIQTLLDT